MSMKFGLQGENTTLHHCKKCVAQVLVAQKDAELQHLRQRVKAPPQQGPQVRNERTTADAGAAPAERMQGPNKDKFLMAGR